MSEERYLRNMTLLSPEENDRLKTFRVCVIGCGGLGGYNIEMLGRLGVGQITAVDGDLFEPTNLNRQLLADETTLGHSKALAAQERMQKVNPLVRVIAVAERLTAANGRSILQGHDLIIDALDNLQTRFLLQDLARELAIPLIHGAVAGWYGKVTTIFPGDDTLTRLYRHKDHPGLEQNLGTPSFTPAMVAAIQVSEAVKVLLNKGKPLRHQLLYIDLHTNLWQIIDC